MEQYVKHEVKLILSREMTMDFIYDIIFNMNVKEVSLGGITIQWIRKKM